MGVYRTNTIEEIVELLTFIFLCLYKLDKSVNRQIIVWIKSKEVEMLSVDMRI